MQKFNRFEGIILGPYWDNALQLFDTLEDDQYVSMYHAHV